MRGISQEMAAIKGDSTLLSYSFAANFIIRGRRRVPSSLLKKDPPFSPLYLPLPSCPTQKDECVLIAKFR